VSKGLGTNKAFGKRLNTRASTWKDTRSILECPGCLCLDIEGRLAWGYAWELERLRQGNIALELSKRLKKEKACGYRLNTRASAWKDTRSILEGPGCLCREIEGRQAWGHAWQLERLRQGKYGVTGLKRAKDKQSLWKTA